MSPSQPKQHFNEQRVALFEQDIDLNVANLAMKINARLPECGAKREQIEREGPRTEPCGTPHESRAKEDTESPMLH